MIIEMHGKNDEKLVVKTKIPERFVEAGDVPENFPVKKGPIIFVIGESM